MDMSLTKEVAIDHSPCQNMHLRCDDGAHIGTESTRDSVLCYILVTLISKCYVYNISMVYSFAVDKTNMIETQ